MLCMQRALAVTISLLALYKRYGSRLESGSIKKLADGKLQLKKQTTIAESDDLCHMFIVDENDKFVKCKTKDSIPFTFSRAEFNCALKFETPIEDALTVSCIMSLNALALFVTYGSELTYGHLERYGQLDSIGDDAARYDENCDCALISDSQEIVIDNCQDAEIIKMENSQITLRNVKTGRKFMLTASELKTAFVRYKSTESDGNYIWLNTRVKLDFSPMFKPPVKTTYELSLKKALRSAGCDMRL